MRHRPFRFFFGLAIGFVLLSFVARVFVFALLAAAVMSTIYFVGRRVFNFFRYMTWTDDRYEYEHHRSYQFDNPFEKRFERKVPAWNRKAESALEKWDREWQEMKRERIIEVR